MYIERSIAIHPSFLNSQIETKILQKIKSEYLGKCDEKVGYITKIYDNINIISNHVSNAGSGVIFKVKFKIQNVKPEVGKEYEGKVCMVIEDGLLVEVLDLMKVLIPIENTNGYEYKNDVLVKGDSTIDTGDLVNIVMTKINYEKKKYQIVASLKNKKSK